MTTVAQGGVFPVAPEPQRAYRVIDDAEATAAGLSTTFTEADKLREENARLRDLLARGGGSVVDDRQMNWPGSPGTRSSPPIVDERPAQDMPRPAVPWDQLPARTRRELEAGRAALGGGLSAREAYERAAKPPPATPIVTVMLEPEPAAPLSARTQAEQARGKAVLALHMGERERVLHELAVRNAAKLAAGFKPTGDELFYPPDPV